MAGFAKNHAAGKTAPGHTRKGDNGRNTRRGRQNGLDTKRVSRQPGQRASKPAGLIPEMLDEVEIGQVAVMDKKDLLNVSSGIRCTGMIVIIPKYPKDARRLKRLNKKIQREG